MKTILYRYILSVGLKGRGSRSTLPHIVPHSGYGVIGLSIPQFLAILAKHTNARGGEVPTHLAFHRLREFEPYNYSMSTSQAL